MNISIFCAGILTSKHHPYIIFNIVKHVSLLKCIYQGRMEGKWIWLHCRLFPQNEGQKGVCSRRGHKNKLDQMKEFCSDDSCNSPKQLRTKKYHSDVKHKSPPEIIGKTYASTTAATSMAPA